MSGFRLLTAAGKFLITYSKKKADDILAKGGKKLTKKESQKYTGGDYQGSPDKVGQSGIDYLKDAGELNNLSKAPAFRIAKAEGGIVKKKTKSKKSRGSGSAIKGTKFKGVF